MRRRTRILTRPATLSWLVALAAGALTLLGPLPAAGATTLPQEVTLQPSLPSPQPVETTITWRASSAMSTPVYRFSVGASAGGPFTVVRDFSPRNSFAWARLHEGIYYIQVTVQNGYTGTITRSAVASFTLTSRVKGKSAVVSRTANPLVALYSAPACSAGQRLVRFRAMGDTAWISTVAELCQAGQSSNILVAGMRAQTTYQMVDVVISGTTAITSTPLSFTTGAPPSSVVFPAVSVQQPPSSESDTAEPLVFHALVAAPSIYGANPFASDLQGRLVWYTVQPDLINVWALRIEQVLGQPGDAIYLLGNDLQQKHNDNVLRAVDLLGNPVRETNVQAVNAQLAARGQQPIYGFSHDAMLLPNGDTAVIGFVQKTITTTSIMGDMLVVLDQNLQVAWTWNSFDHLNPYRGPTLGDTCGQSYSPCPVPGGPNTIDWTHANAIDYSPTDGDLILSLRSQDWIVKINYANGAGNGAVLWRLGKDGNFTLVPQSPSDPYPWFSHQHDVNYINPTTLEMFDNGNTRCVTDPLLCYSRGQVYTVDEQSKVVTQTVNVDVGTYSAAMGAAQRLSNGSYNFASDAVVVPPPPYGLDGEMLPDGTKTYVQRINTLEYRAWRLATLYSSINPPCPSCPG